MTRLSPSHHSLPALLEVDENNAEACRTISDGIYWRACERNDVDAIHQGDSTTIIQKEYDLSVLRKQLNKFGFSGKGGQKTTARSLHFATFTIAQPATPPTSPQPKDLIRFHLKNRKGFFQEEKHHCHVMYLDGMEVSENGFLNDSRSTSAALSPSSLHSSLCVSPETSEEYQFKEGMRKRKSIHLIGDDEELDSSVDNLMIYKSDKASTVEKLKHQRSMHNDQNNFTDKWVPKGQDGLLLPLSYDKNDNLRTPNRNFTAAS
jgi:hypothetical protein